jgi:hypothetical protein
METERPHDGKGQGPEKGGEVVQFPREWFGPQETVRDWFGATDELVPVGATDDVSPETPDNTAIQPEASDVDPERRALAEDFWAGAAAVDDLIQFPDRRAHGELAPSTQLVEAGTGTEDVEDLSADAPRWRSWKVAAAVGVACCLLIGLRAEGGLTAGPHPGEHRSSVQARQAVAWRTTKAEAGLEPRGRVRRRPSEAPRTAHHRHPRTAHTTNSHAVLVSDSSPSSSTPAPSSGSAVYTASVPTAASTAPTASTGQEGTGTSGTAASGGGGGSGGGSSSAGPVGPGAAFGPGKLSH